MKTSHKILNKMYYLLLLLILFSYSSNAQSWQWAKAAGGFAQANEDEFTATAVDDSGNVYVAGKFKDRARFDSLEVNAEGSNFDAFVAKYSCQGKLKWLRRIEGKGYVDIFDMILDDAGNPIIVGRTGGNIPSDSITFGDSTFHASYQAFIFQVLSNGQRGWMYLPNFKVDFGPYSELLSLKNGTFMLFSNGGGEFIPGDTVKPGLFVARFSNLGKVLHAQQVAGEGALPYDFNVHSDGNIGFSVLAGNIDSFKVFDQTYYDPEKRGISVFGKMDINGNKIWAKATDAGSYLTARVDVNLFREYENGYILFGTAGKFGTYNGDTLFKEDSKSRQSGVEAYIMKVDKNLNKLWHYRTSSKYSVDAWNMEIDSKGIAYMTGHVAGPMYFGSNTITTTSRSDDCFLAFDLKTQQWVSYEMLLTSGDDNDKNHDLVIDNEDNVILAGKFEGGFYFDPNGPNTDTLYMWGGNSNALLLKYGSTRCPLPKEEDTTTVPDNIATIKLFTNGFTIYPNPSKGNVTINLKEKQTTANLAIYTLKGEQIYQQQITESKTTQINVANYPVGIYLVEVTNSETRWIERLVVE